VNATFGAQFCDVHALERYRKVGYAWKIVELPCWGRMEKITLTDHVRNGEVLLRVREERNVLHTIKLSKFKCIVLILNRNWLLKDIIKGKIEVTLEVMGRCGRRIKKLLDDLNEKRGYWKLKVGTLDPTLRRTHFGKGYGPVKAD
jgi:hypothetical protein